MNLAERKAEQIVEIKEVIRQVIDGSHSTLSQEDEGDDFINFATRENGDVGAEEHSDMDYNDAYNIKVKIDKKYSDKLEATIETVGEFVYLNFKFI